MRPIIVGMANPRSTDPADALSCFGKRGTGYRLWELLNDLTGATMDQYMQAFDRRNLVTGEWSLDRARQAAELFRVPRGSEVLVLGSETATALGLPKMLVHPVEKRSATWRQVPHPSGRCRFYNDEVQSFLVSLVLKSLYEKNQNPEGKQR